MKRTLHETLGTFKFETLLLEPSPLQLELDATVSG
jgi:hypothetical protein